MKQELKTGKVLEVVHKYLVRLPTEEAHHTCHPTKGAMGFSQRIHPDLIVKIQELVCTGITDPLVVQRLLRQHVCNCMCASNPADPNDRSYFPLLDDVRNHVNRAKQSLKLSVIDQENAVKKVEQWKMLSPEAHFLFRPYHGEVEQPNEDEEDLQNEEDLQEHSKITLLWVHQEVWQQQLMAKYGNTIALMDATYKTTRYELPLFFISVRTNSGYCVVADFIVQSESTEHVTEALQVIKQWNPSWNPNYFMTDYSEAEIAALEAVFEDSYVYLCDFHREQAWERWIRDKNHKLSASDAEWLLCQLRACAWAPSSTPDEQVPVDHHFQQAVAVIQQSNLWKTNESVRQWVTNTWLKVSKVCIIM